MEAAKREFLVVGSGMGGATLAMELARRSKDVLVLERGRLETKVGTFTDALRYYDTSNRLTQTPAKSKEGVILWRALAAGGSTLVSCGNGVRCLESELADLGIRLEEDFAAAEREMGVAPIHERLLSEGSERIRVAAADLGYRMDPMPKFIDPEKCGQCGQCVFGCKQGAKWTALHSLQEAQGLGAEVRFGTAVQEIVVERGRAVGVRVVGPTGPAEIKADTVIASAGGLGTPVILQRSGIEEAGQGLFVDLFVNSYAETDGLNQLHEPVMALVNHQFHRDRGFILSPFVQHTRVVRVIEGAGSSARVSSQKLLGIMTKTTDDPAGRVYPNGSVSKRVSENDWNRLHEGSQIAREILVKAGGKPRSITVSAPQGAHPGGTAAIGRVVDRDLQTRVDNLFVCDASVLPAAPGMPPMLTIAALARRLARTLAG